jgi:hypothetical protein
MNEIDYSIDKVKLMIKVKWYELRCSFHRHNSGEYFELQAWSTARLRKLIEAECADRGWLVDDTVVIEIEKRGGKK